MYIEPPVPPPASFPPGEPSTDIVPSTSKSSAICSYIFKYILSCFQIEACEWMQTANLVYKWLSYHKHFCSFYKVIQTDKDTPHNLVRKTAGHLEKK